MFLKLCIIVCAKMAQEYIISFNLSSIWVWQFEVSPDCQLWVRRKSATPPADFLRCKKKIIVMSSSDTLMRNISALACDTDSYLITVLWVGASENASRSAGPRLDALLVPFLLTNKKQAIMSSMCCLKTSNMITDLWREQNEEQQCGSCCSLAGD